MSKIELFRSAGDKLGGTPGVLLIDSVPFCCTLELPWLNNQKNISCIPAGEYHCTWEKHPRFPQAEAVVRLAAVPGREGVLIHPGNSAGDIQGCILLGKNFSPTKRLYLEYSTLTLERLRIETKQHSFLLRIEWISGTLAPVMTP